MLNPLLRASPLKLTCDVLQLVLPRNKSNNFEFSTYEMMLPKNSCLGTANSRADAGKRCFRRAQPLWWQTTSRFTQLDAALQSNLVLLAESNALAKTVLLALHGASSTVGGSCLDMHASSSSSSADSSSANTTEEQAD
jgi:hypothetical protein